MDRRKFLKTSAATVAASSLPHFSIGQGGPSANGKLNLAMIGAGGIAQMAYKELAKTENIVALCDVDSERFLQYGEKFPQLEKARQFADFRKMFDALGDEIDAVCINTPDHTHFVATMEAMQRGKHVCTQKPLAHTIWEGRTLQKAKDHYGLVTNMANQGHTTDGIRQMREWFEAGLLGDVTKAYSWTGGPDWNGNYFSKPASLPLSPEAAPPTLDWDLWLGPAEERPYSAYFHPLTWRGFYPFGGGQLVDWFCHIADAPVWVLGLYEPVVIEAEEVIGGDDFLTPDQVRVRFDFEARGELPPMSYWWSNGPEAAIAPEEPDAWGWGKVPNGGTFFHGDKATAYTDKRSNNPRITREIMLELKQSNGFPEETYPRVKGKGPFHEWAKAIKGRGPEPGSNFDYAAKLTEVSLLGVLAQRFGGRIEWDAQSMRITNRPELNQYLRTPARTGWEYGEDLWKS
ncbi:MAG: Gfo/Idh/MocA family oxidoreductase [Verrucomicrobiota bacterium]